MRWYKIGMRGASPELLHGRNGGDAVNGDESWNIGGTGLLLGAQYHRRDAPSDPNVGAKCEE
jgi:hypothetical protein